MVCLSWPPSIRIYLYFYGNLTVNTDEILKILDSSVNTLYMKLMVKYGNYMQNTDKWCVVY